MSYSVRAVVKYPLLQQVPVHRPDNVYVWNMRSYLKTRSLVLRAGSHSVRDG